jgi:hypothetical protein
MEKVREFTEKLRTYTKISIISGIGLLLFSLIVQKTGIYFFWESSWIGYTILLIGILLLLIDWKNIRKSKNLKTIWNKIGIGIVIFLLIVKTVVSIILPRTDAYEIAKSEIKSNNQITNEIGEIERISFIPTGGIQVSKDSQGEYGSATISFILKGNEKFKIVTILVTKYPDTDWIVEQIF